MSQRGRLGSDRQVSPLRRLLWCRDAKMHPAQKRGRPCEVPGAPLCRTSDPCGELPSTASCRGSMLRSGNINSLRQFSVCVEGAMKVELPGESKSFADIDAGECFAFTRNQVTSVCMKVEWLSSASIVVLWAASDDWTVPHLIKPIE